MNVKLDEGAFALSRAHKTDAGLDLRAMESKTVRAYSTETFRTGVHVQLPKGTCGILISKSGLNVKHDITSTGLIDEGYTGEILVKLHNHGSTSYRVEAGDKISQLVVVPVVYEPIVVCSELNEDSERGNNGFGSSGR